MRDLEDVRWREDREWSQGLGASRNTRWQDRLLTALCSIAKDLRLEDPAAEAKRIKNRLLRRIAQEEAARVGDRRYNAFINPWRSARWALRLVRFETNRQSIGRLRGPKSLTRKEAMTWAINNASNAKAEDLTPVERRAVEMLARSTGRLKPRKNIIESRAMRLAERVKQSWFPDQRKSNVGRRHEFARTLLLSITDVISIAAPIIEEFAKRPIAFRKRGSDSDPPSFEALYSIVCLRAKGGAACQKSTVNRLHSRVRKRVHAHVREDAGVRTDIAPELAAHFQPLR